MASIRKLKKGIKKSTDRLIEDAIIDSWDLNKKDAKELDQTIDAIIEDRVDFIHQLHQLRKQNAETGKRKASINPLKKAFHSKIENYRKEIPE